MPRNDSTAIILIHGFTGSPSQVQWLGKKLEGDGFDVIIPKLKGHGTKPADLFHCSYRDWVSQTEQVFLETQQKYRAVFVAGLSMGGTLALRLAAYYHFDGVIALAAPIRLSMYSEIFVRSMHRFFRWRHKANGSDIKDRSVEPQLNTYNTYPTRAAGEFFKLLREARPLLSKITMPILIMHGREDHVVPAANAVDIHLAVASKMKKLIMLENSYHIVTMDFDREWVHEEVKAFVETAKQGRVVISI